MRLTSLTRLFFAFCWLKQSVSAGRASTLGQHHRDLALTGSETFVAIRVVATGCNPACSSPPTIAKIADDLYEDSVNLVTVTKGCSFNKFTIGPAADINGKVLAKSGVYEVTVTDDIFNITVSDARSIVNDQLAKPEELGANFQDGADKFIYFFPPELRWPINPAGNEAPGFASGNTLNLNVGFYDSTRGHVRFFSFVFPCSEHFGYTDYHVHFSLL